MSDRYGYIGIETLLNFCENTKDHAVTPNDFMRLPRIASGTVNKEAVIALLEQLAAEEKAVLDQFDDEQAFGAYCALEGAVEKVEAMKTDQPERKTDEWCTDCSEYDHERHCCPRFNRVIRTVLDEVKPQKIRGRWIHQDNIAWVDTWQCSECGEQTTVTIMGEPRFKYCPMCGAAMEEK